MKPCRAEPETAPSPEKESLAPRPERQLFFRFAQENCCNYSPKGPWGKRHYCWLGPPKTDSLCVIPYGLTCRWFAEAVLPLDKALEAEWQRLRRLEADPDAPPQARRERICLCGAQFVPRSNRQLYCQECSKQRRLEQLRKNARKYRRRKG